MYLEGKVFVLNLIEDIGNYWNIVLVNIDKIIITGAVNLTSHYIRCSHIGIFM